MRITLQPAYIIHSRPYRDSSLLLEVFTAEYGRVSLVGKGSRRRARGGSTSALLQPFRPILVSFIGRGELRTLTAAEAVAGTISLRGDSLYSGLYINELLYRLLHRDDPHPALFARYGQALQELMGNRAPDVALRKFEYYLLNDLGYGFDFAVDGIQNIPVHADAWYHFHPDHGMVAAERNDRSSQAAYSGAELLAMAAGEFEGDIRLPAKRLMRQALALHLGSAPLVSRELFRGRSTPAKTNSEQSGASATGASTGESS